MKVKDLIAELSKIDGELVVMIFDYDYDEHSQINGVVVKEVSDYCNNVEPICLLCD